MSDVNLAVRVAGRRPGAVVITIALLVFLGLSALPSGADLVLGGWIARGLPADWLDRLPLIDSWLLPGLVLGIGFGLGSLVTAYGMASRSAWPLLNRTLSWTGHRWPWSATIALGLGQVAWVALELVYLPQWSWLQPIYGATGIALMVLPLLPTVRTHLRVPRRTREQLSRGSSSVVRAGGRR